MHGIIKTTKDGCILMGLCDAARNPFNSYIYSCCHTASTVVKPIFFYISSAHTHIHTHTTFVLVNVMQCVRADVGGTAGWGSSSSSISLCDWISRGCSWEAANCCPDLAGKTAAGFSGPTQPCQLWVDLGTAPVSHSDCSTCCAAHKHIDFDITHTCIYVLIVEWCLRLFCFALF